MERMEWCRHAQSVWGGRCLQANNRTIMKWTNYRTYEPAAMHCGRRLSLVAQWEVYSVHP